MLKSNDGKSITQITFLLFPGSGQLFFRPQVNFFTNFYQVKVLTQLSYFYLPIIILPLWAPRLTFYQNFSKTMFYSHGVVFTAKIPFYPSRSRLTFFA